MRDLYELLGVRPDASAEEIHSAYRRLARRYHPDVGAGSDHARFKELSSAYDVLRDPEQRARYDRSFGRAIVRARPARPATPVRPAPVGPAPVQRMVRSRVPYFSDRVSTRDVPRFIE